jgi:hypothetical protein
LRVRIRRAPEFAGRFEADVIVVDNQNRWLSGFANDNNRIVTALLAG